MEAQLGILNTDRLTRTIRTVFWKAPVVYWRSLPLVVESLGDIPSFWLRCISLTSSPGWRNGCFPDQRIVQWGGYCHRWNLGRRW